MPGSAERIAAFFGLELSSAPGNSGGLDWNDLGKPEGLPGPVTSEVLFTKLEDEQIAALREQYSGSQKERSEKKAGEAEKAAAGVKSPEAIAAAFASTLDLRVAKIVKIERHPNAEKLYIETLEIAAGEASPPESPPEERVIVSGLVPFYTEEELLGKHIIVAYNLKAAKLRGVMSKGMLLAASDHNGSDGAERCEVLDAADIPTGTSVVLEGTTAGTVPEEITIDDFFGIPLEVKGNTVCAGGKALTLNGKPIKTKVIRDGEVH
jgi:methionyl-tRNA synthetase